MDAKVRSQRDLGIGMQKFRADVPDQSAGETAAGTDLDGTLHEISGTAQVEVDAEQQRLNATATKQELRRTAEGHVRHLTEVAHRAIRAIPDAELKIRIIPRTVSYNGFVDRARVIQQDATANKEMLIKQGLSEAVLTEYVTTVDRLEQVIGVSVSAEQSRKRAHARLADLGRNIVHIGRVLDPLYRTRFRNNPDMLSEWETATIGLRVSRKARKPAPATPAAPVPPASGADVRPAA